MPAESPAPPGDVIYLDHAAATPLLPEVAVAMDEATRGGFANPSSPHAAGRRARRILEDARERILELVGGRTAGAIRDRLVFTSGATEANRLGILGMAAGRPGVIAFSARDHGSVAAAATELTGRGWTAVRMPLTSTGALADPIERLAAARRGDSPLVLCLTTVCGQTGIREDRDLASRLRAAGPCGLVHADATQGVTWDDVRFCDTDVATLAFAPHKFGGPRGIGGLVVRGEVAIAPLVPGPQELGLRGGTEAVALAAGFARALELAVARRAEAARHVARLRAVLEREVVAAAREVGIEAVIVGATADRAPHVSTIAVVGHDRQAVVMAADLAGVCLGTGTACASGSSEPAPAVVALGLPAAVIHGAVRASLGPATTEAEIRAAAGRLADVFRGLARPGLQRGAPHR